VATRPDDPDTPPPGRLPDFVVIGAMKCGTSSLRHYLALHPEVFVAEQSPDFFLEEHNWPRGVAWYRARFVDGARVCGEVSPRYTNAPFFAGVPERMHAVLPDAKLLYVVRDPVERLVSHWMHARAYGREDRPFAEALRDLEGNVYVGRSRYALQLAPFLARYPRARLLVLYQEDLWSRRGPAMRRVFAFLGVDPAFTSAGFGDLKHRSADLRRAGSPIARPTVPEALRRTLRALFREDMAYVAELAGGPCPAWR
jgi:hypothetical protein